MEPSNFDKLLQRYLTGQVSEKEKVKIEAWLEMVKGERKAELDLTKEEEENLYQKIVAETGNFESATALPETSGGRRLSKTLFKIAASVAFFLVATVTILYLTQNFSATPFSNTDTEKVILNDGSIAWLRGKSKIVFYKKTAEHIRYAELDGEALFEIAKNPLEPFVIQCGDVKVTVVGTSFNLSASDGRIELIVLTGIVNVKSATQNIDVRPNEKLIVSVNRFDKFPVNTKELPALSADTEYIMEFDNIPLGEIMHRLSEKFDVQIEFTNDDIQNCRMTADFTDRSLEASLRMITEVLDVSYSREGGSITVSGSGCK
jgi:transmembrane sensor